VRLQPSVGIDGALEICLLLLFYYYY